MQRYLLSSNQRIEEWRVKKSDKEHWMRHRQLPQELRESVHRYDRYKWVATYGVDEETLLSDLPKGLRRQIKRHLCLNLVRRVRTPGPAWPLIYLPIYNFSFNDQDLEISRGFKYFKTI